MEKKKIRAIIDVEIEVTDDELFEIMRKSELEHLRNYHSYGFEDIELNEQEAAEFMKRGKPVKKVTPPEYIHHYILGGDLDQYDFDPRSVGLGWYETECKKRGIER